jgi:hypothetical protein
LTGLSDPGGRARRRSAVSVEIDNEITKRPQSGLDVADVVFEQVVAGGITRFWAVFNSAAPAHVGPIREDRRMDPEIVAPLRGVVVSSGGPGPQIPRASGLVVDPTTAAPAFSRDPNRRPPSNLYVRPQMMWRRGRIPPSPLFHYTRSASFAGMPVEQVTLGFSGSTMTYSLDRASGTWLRFQDSQPFRSDTAKQILTTNVVVQLVEYPNPGQPEVIGHGDAWIFSAGRVIKGHWSKTDASQTTRYTNATGKVIRVAPGRTWVELLPTGSSVQTTPGT